MRPAGERLNRILAIIAYLDRHGTCSVDELSSRFGLEPDELRVELEKVACCGLPPYTPDTLIEILVYEDHVQARVPHYFTQPQRLGAADGVALLAAGEAMMAVPGADTEGPLPRALVKLSEVLGVPSGITVDLGAPVHLTAVRNAATDRLRIEIDYYSLHSDEVTTRAIDPYVVFSDDGRWYVRGLDHQSDQQRTFRVDRIRDLRPTGESFEPSAEEGDPQAFTGGPETERVVLRLPLTAQWVVETYPVESWEERSGHLEVVLEVGSERWLERLLLRVGPEATVMEPAHRQTMAADAATRVLDTVYRR